VRNVDSTQQFVKKPPSAIVVMPRLRSANRTPTDNAA